MDERRWTRDERERSEAKPTRRVRRTRDACLRMLLCAGSLALFLPVIAFAADQYVRAGAIGNGNAADWDNAYPQLPATLIRGDTYWIADGNYPSYTFDDPVSGTQVITVKKATVTDHGTNTGWDNAYGDGQAIFSSTGTILRFDTAYWVLDGQVGSGTSGHGFVVKMTDTTTGLYGIHLYTAAASNITIAHTEVYHTDPCIAVANDVGQDAIRTAGTGADNITVQYVYLHDIPGNLILTANASNWTVEYSWLESSHSWPSNHGQAIYFGLTAATGWRIRYNTFKNINGSAVIFFSQTISDTLIYGNVFWEEASSVGCGNFSTGALLGSNTTGVTSTRFYNNTIVTLDGRGTASDNIQFDAGLDNLAYNNLWYGTTPTFTNATGAFNDVNVSDPTIFVNYSGGDFRLTRATSAGTTLSSPFNTDPFGNTRGADGTWDRGAYEFVSQTILYGDVSENGSVTAYDASLASQYAVGLITLTSIQITKADVSGNGSVSAYDASLIAQYAVGLITKFPVEG